MDNETNSAIPPVEEQQPAQEDTESFGKLLSQFEQEHKHRAGDTPQLEGTVVSVAADAVYLDIGFKIEGVLPRTEFEKDAEDVKTGDRFPVSIKGRNEEGYYALSRFKVAQPTDWSSLEKAFADKTPIPGTVTGVVKGGLSVDVGVRAFMPASRSGTHDAAAMEKLVGEQITCRIIKLDVGDEDVVVDRRSVLEEQAHAMEERRYGELSEGDVVSGEVRSLTSYGAFIDLGGLDGLLHVSDMAWNRVSSPEEVLTVGQKLQVKVLKIDADNKRISLGLKQLQAEPWETAAERYKSGERVTGTVTRLADFGAFVELEPGVEGLIHVSEMSWIKRVRKPSDILKQGDTVETVILSIDVPGRRLSLGLKQALGDPWSDATKKYPAGSVIEGPVTRLAPFGAFVQLAEGVEGLVHISEISAEKHLHHPQDALHAGEVVKALVLAVDEEKRQIKLSMKQLVPTGLDEYFTEHKVGDKVSGRIIEQTGLQCTVELGEGIRAMCTLPSSAQKESSSNTAKADLSSLTSMLQARWKGTSSAEGTTEQPRPGQVRTFRITKLAAETKQIELELA